jgi:putative glycosyltransferase (TIGR04372 family)
MSVHLKRYFLYILNGTWAVPLVILIRILEPIFQIRIGSFLGSRIGHFIVDPILFLARNNFEKKKKVLNLFWIAGPISNSHWKLMIERYFLVYWWVRYLDVFNRYIPGGSKNDLSKFMYSGRIADFEVLNYSDTVIKFLTKENETAINWLTGYGWKVGERFICINVRDSAYLNKALKTESSTNWDYHNYRDSKIETYEVAINYLLKRGYWVIRLGKIAHTPISFDHPHLIDYPFLETKNDLLDIWFILNCSLLITTASGTDALAMCYKRPVLYLNALPLLLCSTTIPHTWVPKNLTWKNSGIDLSLKEYLRHSYVRTDDYELAGINIIDLSSQEVLEAVIECEEKISGTYIKNHYDDDLQKEYWDRFKEYEDFNLYHNQVNPEARIGSAWLKSKGKSFLKN